MNDFAEELWDKYPGDWERIGRMAIIAHGLCAYGSSGSSRKL